MTKEALKLALEALETPWNAPYVNGCDLALGKKVKAITAIKEALANEALEKMAENARELGLDYEPEQEPVAWMNQSDNNFFSKQKDTFTSSIPLYTTPPQRTWVNATTWRGLTDEDKASFWTADQMTKKEWDELFATIEAKLKAKNT